MVLQLLTVVIPAALAAVATWRRPTLRRRIAENLTLLEKLPSELRQPIRDTLRLQLRELALEEWVWTKHRLERRLQNVLFAFWIFNIFALTALSALFDAARRELSFSAWLSADAPGPVFVIGGLSAPLLAWFLSFAVTRSIRLFLRFGNRRKKRRRAKKRAERAARQQDGPEQLTLPGM